eukprot:1188198-Prorocentrum_minimum.AAC.1
MNSPVLESLIKGLMSVSSPRGGKSKKGRKAAQYYYSHTCPASMLSMSLTKMPLGESGFSASLTEFSRYTRPKPWRMEGAASRGSPSSVTPVISAAPFSTTARRSIPLGSKESDATAAPVG